jgi:hypothetical protein
MPAELHERTKDILDRTLPYYYRDDPATHSVIDPAVRELARIEEMLNVLRASFAPQNADDTYGLLSLWEEMLLLPVAPAGVDLAVRRNTVLAWLRTRKSGAGTDWMAAITKLLGTENWSHKEYPHPSAPAPYQVAIDYPFAETSFTGGQVRQLLAVNTPAHIEVLASPGEGFVIGIAQIGASHI